MWRGKGEQVADVLRDLIAAGEWTGQLPGYRTLEQRLKVNRETIEKALRRLEEEGWVGPSAPGKRRTICHRSPSKRTGRQSSLLVIGPRPLHDCSPVNRTMLTRIFQEAESRGWRVVYHHFDFEFPRRAVSSMKRSVADHRPDRVLLQTPSEALEKWALSAPVSCFRLGGSGSAKGIQSLQGVGLSFSGMVCKAAAMLWERGHRRLMIPIVSGKQVMRERTIEASAASWARGVPLIELEAMFPDQGEWLPDVLRGFWPREFPRLLPTAVIVKESNEFLSLLSYCHRQRVRIPRDLSVVQLAGDPASLWLDPQPDRFEFPVEAMCQKVMRWLENAPAKEGSFDWLEPTYHRGGTVAGPGKD
ncbi:substrate-binding domain-containing protein [Luteolibacter ambystomatis]|uniref:Substrate-binding domain-containing protein n=1 Tax=Luteolibacter ambystomatis TaxID=2824561 RepID=A0A975IZ23_9BACT|nr:substrate-binding domain-containing protein [Luteolibacter ambystomatis]QUE51016.1 substrate-binding domain-containing protein [Luteolibacter ambystomatis]